jgi:hypothetical protein
MARRDITSMTLLPGAAVHQCLRALPANTVVRDPLSMAS